MVEYNILNATTENSSTRIPGVTHHGDGRAGSGADGYIWGTSHDPELPVQDNALQRPVLMITTWVRSLTARAGIAVLAGAVAVVAGCTLVGSPEDDRPKLSNDLIVGDWQDTSGSGTVLSFDDDGTFRAIDVPTTIFGGSLERQLDSVVVSGSGGWTLTEVPSGGNRWVEAVVLSFRELEDSEVSYSMQLWRSWVEDELVLFFFIGDPDLGNRYVLEQA